MPCSQREQVLQIIAERGLEFGENLKHKHNVLDASKPNPPFKIHLCLQETRPEGKLMISDLRELGSLLAAIAIERKLDIAAIAGTPKGGSGLAEYLQESLAQRGVRVPRLTYQKIDNEFQFVDNGGYQGGPIWGVDDLVHHSHTKLQFNAAVTSPYFLRGFLVVLDYDVGARDTLRRAGLDLQFAAKVDDVLLRAHTQPLVNITKAQAYLREERAALASRK